MFIDCPKRYRESANGIRAYCAVFDAHLWRGKGTGAKEYPSGTAVTAAHCAKCQQCGAPVLAENAFLRGLLFDWVKSPLNGAHIAGSVWKKYGVNYDDALGALDDLKTAAPTESKAHYEDFQRGCVLWLYQHQLIDQTAYQKAIADHALEREYNLDADAKGIPLNATDARDYEAVQRFAAQPKIF